MIQCYWCMLLYGIVLDCFKTLRTSKVISGLNCIGLVFKATQHLKSYHGGQFYWQRK